MNGNFAYRNIVNEFAIYNDKENTVIRSQMLIWNTEKDDELSLKPNLKKIYEIFLKGKIPNILMYEQQRKKIL